jgi:hypothetical protein
MSGSVFFEGSAYIDGGQIQNTIVLDSTIGNSAITTSSLDMNMANITSVKDPIDPQDAATKKYVDNLEVVFNTVTLNGTQGSVVSNYLQGSYVVAINNIVVNGPSGIFHATKNEAHRYAHIVRTVASPGYTSNVTLMISWPPNSGITLYKTGGTFDGSYRVKLV